MVEMRGQRLVVLGMMGLLLVSTTIILFENSSAGSITTELTPTDDAYVDSGNSYTNFGYDSSLTVSYTDYYTQSDHYQVIFLKFDLSGIPEGSTINSANLKLYCFHSDGTPFVGVFGGEWRGWDEGTVTFLNSNFLSFSDNLLDYHYIFSQDMWCTWDVTDFVQNHIGREVTFQLATSTDLGWASFWSKDSYTPERPKLSIKYSSPNQPSCTLSANPSSGHRPLTVTFSMSASDNDGFIASWSLDVNNDGSPEYSGSGNPPTTKQHTYHNVGIYTAKLTVTDNDGVTCNTTRTIIVHVSHNQKPIAGFTYSPLEPTDLDTIVFTDSSIDLDGNIVSWTWNFGDGNTSSNQNPTHKYADDGTYTVTLTVEDNDGATDSESKDVTVSNVKPTANFNYIPQTSVKVGTIINFTDNSTDLDGNIINWTWNFGGGVIVYEKNVNHTYSKDGTYHVTLTVTDNDETTDSYTTTIIVKKEKETPGFEFAILIMAIASLLLIKRKREK